MMKPLIVLLVGTTALTASTRARQDPYRAEHRTQPTLRVAQTGYMQGASGMGMCYCT